MRLDYILHLDLNRLETAGAAGSYNRIAKLAEAGHHLRVFSPAASCPLAQERNVRLLRIRSFRLPLLGKLLFQLNLALRLLSYYSPAQNRPLALIVRHHPLNAGFLLPALLYRIPFFLEVHADIAEELKLDRRVALLPKGLLTAFKVLEKWLFRKACGILLNHEALRRYFAGEYGLPLEKLEVVPNGADVDFFRPLPLLEARRRLGLEPGKRRLLFIGHISKWHGVDYLVEAVPYLAALRKDFVVDIVGREGKLGPVESASSLAEKLGVGNYCNFVGPVSREQAKCWIAAADLCLLPAKMVRRHPGSPVKMFDYMAMGKPILAAAVESYGDIVREHGLGESVDFSDHREAAVAMHRLLQSDLEVYARHNRLLAETKFSWTNRAEAIARFIERRTSGASA